MIKTILKMRFLGGIFLVSFICSALQAQSVSREAYDSLLMRVINLEAHQAFDDRKDCNHAVRPSVHDTIVIEKESRVQRAELDENLRPESPSDFDGFSKWRIGGYGEMAASYKDYGLNRFTGRTQGNSRYDRKTISIPRFVIAGDYRFNRWWQLGAEIEFEAGGTGIAYEFEKKENLEYETEVEKGGEVALEQFHVTATIHPAFNVRLGHIVVPVGLTNAHHEPINFFGVYRPEGESAILPCTWHETGMEIFGEVGREWTHFAYQAQIVAGLNAQGFTRDNWVKGGKQGFFEEDNFSSPAYVARLDYLGVPALRVGGSFYFLPDAGKNCDNLTFFSGMGRLPVRIWTADFEYKNRWVTARGNMVHGNLGSSYAITQQKELFQKNAAPYSKMAPIAKYAVSYAGEVGVNIGAFFSKPQVRLYPFVRYEYYNPQEKGERGQTMEARLQTSMWTLGINWYALPNLVIKADWTTRHIGTDKVFSTHSRYTSENDLSIGVAYVGWWAKK